MEALYRILESWEIVARWDELKDKSGAWTRIGDWSSATLMVGNEAQDVRFRRLIRLARAPYGKLTHPVINGATLCLRLRVPEMVDPPWPHLEYVTWDGSEWHEMCKLCARKLRWMLKYGEVISGSAK